MKMNKAAAEFSPIEEARLQFLMSVDRLLRDSEEAKRSRDFLFDLISQENSTRNATEGARTDG